jgi:plastocyanin
MRMRSMVIVGALLLSSAACEGDTSDPQTCSDPTTTTNVAMEDFFFEPNCLTLEADSTVSLDNSSETPHDFTLEETDVSVNVAAGEEGSADLTGVAPGTYTLVCTIHPQMKGTATIAG